MFEYDPVTSLKHWPEPMARFGKNPHGENLYRIILASSRRHLIGGRWRDGSLGYHWVETYDSETSLWVLERWNTPFEFAKCTRFVWDTTLVDPDSGWPLMGPYPDRGEYAKAFEFKKGVDVAGLDAIIGAIEKGRERSFGQIRQAHAAEYEYEERDSRAQAEAEVRDAVTAFGNSAFSAGRHGRGTKTEPNLRSAEELGLPLMNNPGFVGSPIADGRMDIRNSLRSGGL
jgi:hypothetical protein